MKQLLWLFLLAAPAAAFGQTAYVFVPGGTTAFTPLTSAQILALWAGGSCSGYLKSDLTCPAATGLADPGSNGVVKRTALNTTSVAAFADLVALWASGSCSGYLKSDGTCNAGTTTSPLNVQLGNATVLTPAANTTYYVGVNGAASTVSTNVPVWVAPRSGTVAFDNIGIGVSGTTDTAANNITVTVYDLTTTTSFADTAVTLTANVRAGNVVVSAPSDAVTSGDKLILRVVTPAAWTTPPTAVSFNANILLN